MLHSVPYFDVYSSDTTSAERGEPCATAESNSSRVKGSSRILRSYVSILGDEDLLKAVEEAQNRLRTSLRTPDISLEVTLGEENG